MKTKTQITRLFISLILLTTAFSCKKEKIEEVRPKTVVDFEKSMATDKDFITFSEISLQMMNNIKAKYAGTLTNNYIATPTHVYSVSEIDQSVASIKTKGDLLVLYKKLEITNPEKMVELGEQQSQAYQRFLKNNPEFVNLSVEDRQAVIGKTVDAYQLAHMPITTLNNKRNQTGISAMEDALWTYNVAIENCDKTFGNAIGAIWAAADINMIANAFYAGGVGIPVIFCAALAASSYAMNNQNNCYDTAANAFFHSVGW